MASIAGQTRRLSSRCNAGVTEDLRDNNLPRHVALQIDGCHVGARVSSTAVVGLYVTYGSALLFLLFLLLLLLRLPLDTPAAPRCPTSDV